MPVSYISVWKQASSKAYGGLLNSYNIAIQKIFVFNKRESGLI